MPAVLDRELTSRKHNDEVGVKCGEVGHVLEGPAPLSIPAAFVPQSILRTYVLIRLYLPRVLSHFNRSSYCPRTEIRESGQIFVRLLLTRPSCSFKWNTMTQIRSFRETHRYWCPGISPSMPPSCWSLGFSMIRQIFTMSHGNSIISLKMTF